MADSNAFDDEAMSRRIGERLRQRWPEVNPSWWHNKPPCDERDLPKIGIGFNFRGKRYAWLHHVGMKDTVESVEAGFEERMVAKLESLNGP